MNPPPSLTLRFKKVADADVALTFVRADGSTDTTRIGPRAGYGPVHDLAHYVVESTRGIARGFLGLVAEGWTVRDFEARGAAASLPDDAIVAECLAGQLSTQEMLGQHGSAADFAWGVNAYLRAHRGPETEVEVTAEEFEVLVRWLQALRGAWHALPVGEVLELSIAPGWPAHPPLEELRGAG